MWKQNDRALTVGYGEADLKPPLGASMPGYFQDRKATGFLDPLLAKALYLGHGSFRGALVVLDLIGIGVPQVEAIRRAVHRSHGIPEQNLWVHATHSHTGTMVPRRFTSDANQIVPGFSVGEVDQSWVDALPGRVAEAVGKGQAAARRGEAELGQTRVDHVAFYRRFKMRDGTVRTNPGRNNPNVVGPAGEPDPTLTVLRFPASRALLVVFGMHPDVIGGTQYSADYPAYLTHRVRSKLGDDWNVLFLNAACGNINHIDVANPAQKKGVEESTRLGEILGDAAARALERAERISIDTVGISTKTVDSRLRQVPPEVVKEAERVLREEPAQAQAFNGLFAPAAIVLGRTKDTVVPVEISAMRLGPAGLVGMPGEIFVELAREVQHDSPLDPTRVIGLTNGAFGYIPTAAAFEEGGYETGYRSARFEPVTGQRWAQAAIECLKQLA